MKIKTRQKIDYIIGTPICLFLSLINNFIKSLRLINCANLKKFQIKNVLIIKFWGMGSIMLAADGIYSIKKNIADIRIYFLTLSRNKDFIKYLNIVDEILTINIDANFFIFWADIMKLIFKFLKTKFDVVVDLEFFTRFSAILSFFSRAKIIAGFYDWSVYRGNIHNIKVPFNRYWHVKKNFENLIKSAFAFKKDFKIFSFNIQISDKDIQALKDLLTENKINTDKLVVVNINVGDLALERRWPLEYFLELIESLIYKYEMDVVLIGSPLERNFVEDFIQQIKSSKVFNLAGKLSFVELFALFKIAKFVITSDSGPFHLVDAIGGKVVIFFGPETPVLYGPLNQQNSVVLFKNLDCSPCINVFKGKMLKCYRNRSRPDCLVSITPQEVLEKIIEKGWL